MPACALALGSVRRSLVQTNVTGCARVEVRVEWRRQDQRPLGKGIVVLGACSGKQTSAEVVLSGKRASTFHTATVLIDALDGEDTYVVYFLPFSIDNGLGKLSARYLPPPRGAQPRRGGLRGTRRVELHRAMATTASRAPRDGRRASERRRVGVVALPLPADAPIGQHIARAGRGGAAPPPPLVLRVRGATIVFLGGGGAAGARRLRGDRRAGAAAAAALPASKGPTTLGAPGPWRRGGVPLDKGGTATLWRG